MIITIITIILMRIIINVFQTLDLDIVLTNVRGPVREAHEWAPARGLGTVGIDV